MLTINTQSVWGISDRLSWIAPPNGNVLPWDAQSQPKPAFYAIADALQGKPFSFGNYTEETN
jgi:endo-1,4-beta-xylanase